MKNIFYINLIIMSLYDQYYSDINKEYMFNIIKNIIYEKEEYDISKDVNNYETFISSMKGIFDENNVEELEDMNKILLDHNIKHFQTMIDKNEDTYKNEMDLKLNEYISKREEVTKQNQIDDNQMDDNQKNYLLKNIKITEELNSPLSSTNTNEMFKEINVSTKGESDVQTVYHINSSNRTNVNSSRYNYKVDLMKQTIPCHLLKKISKLIIPIEDIYLFSIPVIVITIPELESTIHMQQEEVIKGLHRKYGIYKPVGNHQLLEKKNDRITIEIKDISEKKYVYSDILKVNIIETKNNKIYFTCSEINKNDYLIGDYIKIINNNSLFLLNVLQSPLKIKKIQKNIIICEHTGISELETNQYTNIDMKIMNMSNQNILYFN